MCAIKVDIAPFKPQCLTGTSASVEQENHQWAQMFPASLNEPPGLILSEPADNPRRLLWAAQIKRDARRSEHGR